MTDAIPPLVQELQWYADKKRWPKGLAPLGGLLKRAIAALPAAEPVAWQFRCEIFPEWQTTDQKPGDQLQMEYETGVNMKGLEVRALYAAPPAPSVAVKAFETNKEMLTAFGAEDIREGSRMCFEANGEDTWEDYYEVPFHALDRIRSALSAQVQDVASLTNEQKETVLLLILDAMGGESDASESKHSWINWFCSDEIHNVQSDTLNRCMEKGWLRYSHNTDTDHGTIYLSPLGRMRAAQMLANLPAAPAKQEAGE